MPSPTFHPDTAALGKPARQAARLAILLLALGVLWLCAWLLLDLGREPGSAASAPSAPTPLDRSPQGPPRYWVSHA